MKNLDLRIITLLLSLCVVLVGCNDDESNPMEEEVVTGNDPALFKFEDLEVGQTFLYSLLQGEQYFNNEEKELFFYTNDTLEIELINIDGNVFTFRERILPTSAMHGSDENYYWMDKDSIYINDWIIENDSLKILATEGFDISSHLFFSGNFWLSGVFIPLQDFSGEQATVEGWKTSSDFCECDRDLFTEDFTLFDTNYDRLNIAIRDTPMAGDGNGSSYIYSTSYGIVRSTHYSAWTGRGFGWDRIQD